MNPSWSVDVGYCKSEDYRKVIEGLGDFVFYFFFLEEIGLLKSFSTGWFFQSGYVDLHFTKKYIKKYINTEYKELATEAN